MDVLGFLDENFSCVLGLGAERCDEEDWIAAVGGFFLLSVYVDYI